MALRRQGGSAPVFPRGPRQQVLMFLMMLNIDVFDGVDHVINAHENVFLLSLLISAFHGPMAE